MPADDIGLEDAYAVETPEDNRRLYAAWASSYDDGFRRREGYVYDRNVDRVFVERGGRGPVLDIGCGTGAVGVALASHGIETVDGLDISPEMLARAEEKAVYRNLAVADLSQPLDFIEPGAYQNAAAIGVLNPNFIPAFLIDQVIDLLPAGGCFVLSLNDHALAEGSMETRVLELTEYGVDLAFKEQGDHLPGIDLQSTVYVLQKR